MQPISNEAERIIVPPRSGRAVSLKRGEYVRFTNVSGGQVGDVFAYAAPAAGERELTEHLSAAHSRAAVNRLFPRIGEAFVTDHRRPILRLESDTSPGHHDLLIAACDPARYAALGHPDHRSCVQNLHEALDALGLWTAQIPQPINIFMRIPVDSDGDLQWLPATASPGDAITFRAETDCVVALSACPQDLAGINAAELSALAIDRPLPDPAPHAPTDREGAV